jgi:cytochrome b pre-mRNA-processing protein 3
MLQWFKRRAEAGRTAEELYGSVVTAARQAAFYRDLGVPDTPEGRFELIALHLFLAVENLKQKGTDTAALLQRTIEVFVTDMDDCMREMGVGDMAVGKKVKRAAAAFYERAGAYRQGLGSSGPDLENSIARYVFGGEMAAGAAPLAQYMRAVSVALSTEPFDTLIARGQLGRLLSNCGSETP